MKRSSNETPQTFKGWERGYRDLCARNTGTAVSGQSTKATCEVLPQLPIVAFSFDAANIKLGELIDVKQRVCTWQKGGHHCCHRLRGISTPAVALIHHLISVATVPDRLISPPQLFVSNTLHDERCCAPPTQGGYLPPACKVPLPPQAAAVNSTKLRRTAFLIHSSPILTLSVDNGRPKTHREHI